MKNKIVKLICGLLVASLMFSACTKETEKTSKENNNQNEASNEDGESSKDDKGDSKDDKEASKDDSEESKTDSNSQKNEDDSAKAENEDTPKEENPEAKEPVALSAAELEPLLLQQPAYVESTEYLVQETEYKSLYPDMLSAIIKNNSGVDIKNVIVCYVAWDSNNFPIKIIGQYDFDGGDYISKCNYEDVNMVNGATFGKDYGMQLSENTPAIATFKAIVQSYTDFEGNTWTNPYYENWEAIYADKKLE